MAWRPHVDTSWLIVWCITLLPCSISQTIKEGPLFLAIPKQNSLFSSNNVYGERAHPACRDFDNDGDVDCFSGFLSGKIACADQRHYD